MKSKLSGIVSVLLLFFALAGCGIGGTQSEKGTADKILVAFSSSGDTFRDALAAAICEAGEKKGITCDLVLAEDQAEKQLKQIEEAESQGYSAIICRLVNSDMALQIERAAGNLPIVFVNNCPSETRLLKDRYMYVGSNEAVAGTYQAEYVLEKLAGKQELNVVIIKGESTHSATVGRTDAAKKRLEESGKTIHYVFEDYADWKTDIAKEYFEIFQKTGGRADCVISNNDSMAIGVVEACKEIGIDPADQLIVGVDATADGCAAIENGDMAFTVCQSAVNQGAAAVDVASILGSGQSASDYKLTASDGYYVWVDYEKVDASNVTEYLP